MPTINQLSQLNQLSGSDQLPVYSASNGDARKASLSTLLAYIEAQFVSPDYVTQYASPNVNGFVVNVASTTQSTWLLLTPTSAFATGTIVLPAAAQIPDGLELLVYSSQDITSLAVSLNGATAVNNAPGALYAGATFALRFDKLSNAWWTVQSAGSYAQGSWTPVLVLGTVVGTVTYTGRWTRVGRQVTVEILIETAAASQLTFTAGASYWTGLPAALVPAGGPNVVATGPRSATYTTSSLVVADFVPGTGVTVTLGPGNTTIPGAPGATKALFTATYTI
jgi:hypothetical protein